MTIETLYNSLLPWYETTLPVSKIKVFFTPFKVKDSKNIAIILKEQNKQLALNALVNLVKNNSKELDVESLCLADAEYLYLKIRSKSVGEEIQLKINEEAAKIHIDEIKVRNSIFSDSIVLQNGISLIVKTPKIKDLLEVNLDDEHALFKKYIKAISVNKELYELNKFVPEEIQKIIENLPYSCIESIKQISKKQPELYVSVKLKDGEREVSGTLSFFTLLQTF
jgi:hypothetical protein